MKTVLERLKKQICSMIDEDAEAIEKTFLEMEGDTIRLPISASIKAEGQKKYTVKSGMHFTEKECKNSREDTIDENQPDLPHTEVEKEKPPSKVRKKRGTKKAK